MSTILSLPAELLELIVGALAVADEHFSSLKAFSLVCHAILPHCQKILFATISLFKRQGKNIQTPNKLLDLLRANPELCPHIRAIKYDIGAGGTSGDLSTLPLISQKLANLQSLILADVVQPTHHLAPHRHKLFPLLHLATLTRLELRSIECFSLADFIPCFGLEQLSINSVRFRDTPFGIAMNPPIPITLHSLSLDNQPSQSLRLLRSARRPDGKPIFDLATLKSLYISLRSDQRLSEMAELFGGGRHLVKLELNSTKSRLPLGGLYDILKGSLKALKYLKFFMFIPRNVTQEDPILVISHELGKLHSRNVVEDINLTILPCSMPRFEPGDEWRTLDHTLSKEGQWPALTNVSLLIWVDRSCSGMRHSFLTFPETHFPGLTASSTIGFGFKTARSWS